MLNTDLLRKLRSMSIWALRLASNHTTLLASHRTGCAILRNAVAVAPPDDAFSPPTKSRQHAWRPPRASIPFNQDGANSDWRLRHPETSGRSQRHCRRTLRLEFHVAYAATDLAGHGNRHHITISRLAYPPYERLLEGQFALFQKKIGVVMVELHAVANFCNKGRTRRQPQLHNLTSRTATVYSSRLRSNSAFQK